MPKRVLDVGNCQPDYLTLKAFLERHFDCQVVQAHGLEDALAELEKGRFDLVTVNRKLDRDYSDGMRVIQSIKSKPHLADLPCMLLTNYPEHQNAAVEAGAVRGFGKLEYDQPETLERLREVLA